MSRISINIWRGTSITTCLNVWITFLCSTTTFIYITPFNIFNIFQQCTLCCFFKINFIFEYVINVWLLNLKLNWFLQLNWKLSFLNNTPNYKLPFCSILGDSRNYIPLILVPSSAIVTQIIVIPKLNRRKDFTLRGFVCDITLPSKELPVQS